MHDFLTDNSVAMGALHVVLSVVVSAVGYLVHRAISKLDTVEKMEAAQNERLIKIETALRIGLGIDL